MSPSEQQRSAVYDRGGSPATGERPPTPGERPATGERQSTGRSATAPTATVSTSKPAAAPGGGPDQAVSGGPRRVRLTVSKLDPWSVMKLSFLLAVALGIILVVAVAASWSVLDGMGVFSSIDRVAKGIAGEQANFSINDYVGFGRVISLATVVAVVDVVLITALSTIGALLYNVSSSLVGGLHVTLTDD